MWLPKGTSLKLAEGVTVESSLNDRHLILWLREIRERGAQNWERFNAAPGKEFNVMDGVYATPAMSICAVKQRRSLVGQITSVFWRRTCERTWLLPNGGVVEQVGERRTDNLLVWNERGFGHGEIERVQSRWPASRRLVMLATNVFVLTGVEFNELAFDGSSLSESAIEQAERLLANARMTGDRRREVLALADLGVACLRNGEPTRSVALLEEACLLVRQLGESLPEWDLLSNLGLALLANGHSQRALEVLNQALTSARANASLVEQQLAMKNLAVAFASLGDRRKAISIHEENLTIARAAHDGQNEAQVLWWMAIEFAELGEKDRAIALAQASIDLLNQTSKGIARQMASEMLRFGLSPSSEILDNEETKIGGPDFLRMATSALKAMSRFIGSGGKMASAEVRRRRLRTCAMCEHHTGVRCRLCGCFTGIKVQVAPGKLSYREMADG